PGPNRMAPIQIIDKLAPVNILFRQTQLGKIGSGLFVSIRMVIKINTIESVIMPKPFNENQGQDCPPSIRVKIRAVPAASI
ncbi:MAG TPA: hypothetical protein PKW69_16425, partial [Niabella sp.]|nr:hypothetical protein [Niabella sp.]